MAFELWKSVRQSGRLQGGRYAPPPPNGMCDSPEPNGARVKPSYELNRAEPGAMIRAICPELIPDLRAKSNRAPV